MSAVPEKIAYLTISVFGEERM